MGRLNDGPTRTCLLGACGLRCGELRVARVLRVKLLGEAFVGGFRHLALLILREKQRKIQGKSGEVSEN